MTNIELQAMQAIIEIPKQLQKLNQEVENLRSMLNQIANDYNDNK